MPFGSPSVPEQSANNRKELASGIFEKRSKGVTKALEAIVHKVRKMVGNEHAGTLDDPIPVHMEVDEAFMAVFGDIDDIRREIYQVTTDEHGRLGVYVKGSYEKSIFLLLPKPYNKGDYIKIV